MTYKACKENGLYTIGDINRICRIPASRLRYYDDIGVIAPCRIDPDSGYRYYDHAVIIQISVLRYYQGCGFKLNEIRELIREPELYKLHELFSRHVEKLNDDIRVIEIERDSIIAWMDLIKEQQAVKKMNDIPIQLKSFGGKRFYYSEPYIWEGMPLKALTANIDMCTGLDKGMTTQGALIVHYSDAFERTPEEAKLYIEPHPSEKPVTDMQELPQCMALTTYHLGDFSDMTETYMKLKKFADEHNFELRGDTFERVVIDWWSTSDENEFCVEAIMPIK